jgi:dTDP-4-dehydrorhamnose reductase
MRVLVTAASGQVGSALAARGKDDVIALSRRDLDVATSQSIEAAMERVHPSLVVNTAAYTAVDRAESEPEAAQRANADGPALLAAACAASGIPLIHLSTDYVFAGDKVGPYFERDAIGPTSVYGRTKAEGERRVLEAQPQSVVLRTAWVYSANGANFVRTMLRLARTRDRISVVDDQVGSPTFAGDLADAILTMSRRLQQDRADSLFGIFHATGAGACSWRQFAEAIFEGSAMRGGPTAVVDPIPTSAYPTAAQRPANSQLHGAKLEAAYGAALPHWREGLSACLDEIAAAGWPAA